MRAARLHEYGKDLQIDEIERPVIRSDAVLLRVVGSQIPAFTKEVVSGQRKYAMPEPFPVIPGPNSLGVVEEIGDHVLNIAKGQLVLVNPRIFGSTSSTTRSRDDILIGWTALSPEAVQTQKIWKDGSWAEYQLVPSSSLTVVPESIQSQFSYSLLSTLSYLAISYGAIVRGDFQAGQIVIITGATGDLGAGAVLVALAMGASIVLAIGRDQDKLEKLKQWDKKRIRTMRYSPSADFNAQRLKDVLDGNNADLVLDFVGGTSDVEPVLTAIRALKYRGKAVFVGNIDNSIPIQYTEIMINEIEIRGCFMFPNDSYEQLIRLVDCGLLDLNRIHTRTYSLDKVNQAIEDAAKKSSTYLLDWVILQPNQS